MSASSACSVLSRQGYGGQRGQHRLCAQLVAVSETKRRQQGKGIPRSEAEAAQARRPTGLGVGLRVVLAPCVVAILFFGEASPSAAQFVA